ncbi:MAG: O-methyltransferase [Candidatus Eisenbacteria bacterium]
MTQPSWAAVDEYLHERLVPHDAALAAALAASEAAGLPAIAVSPSQGKLLHLLALAVGATRILEVGTLGGYSAIWLGRALPPGGQLVTLESDPKHAEVARANLANAGLAGVTEVRLGKALESLPRLVAEGAAPFDLVFIDADKPSNPDYFTWALKLARPGSLILVDNVVREGSVLDAASDDAGVRGVRRLFDVLASEPRVSATAIQTVGLKGWDGLVLARVMSES